MSLSRTHPPAHRSVVPSPACAGAPRQGQGRAGCQGGRAGEEGWGWSWQRRPAMNECNSRRKGCASWRMAQLPTRTHTPHAPTAATSSHAPAAAQCTHLLGCIQQLLKQCRLLLSQLYAVLDDRHLEHRPGPLPIHVRRLAGWHPRAVGGGCRGGGGTGRCRWRRAAGALQGLHAGARLAAVAAENAYSRSVQAGEAGLHEGDAKTHLCTHPWPPGRSNEHTGNRQARLKDWRAAGWSDCHFHHPRPPRGTAQRAAHAASA